MLSTQLYNPMTLRFGRSTTSVSNNSTLDISKTPKVQNTPTTTVLKTDTLSIPKQNSFWSAPHVDLSDIHYPPTSQLNISISQGENVLRHLYLQQMLHPGRVQFHLNNLFETPHVFAFHPALSLLERPTDVISKSAISKAGLCALTHPNVRSFMTPQSRIIFQNISSSGGKTRDTALQTDRWLENLVYQNLATQVINKIGQYDREKLITLFKARDGIKALSSLEALHLGEKGIIDGILVGNNDRIITRNDLDAFLNEKREKHAWTKKDIERFLQDVHRVPEIPSQALKDVFPDSLPSTKVKNDSVPEHFTRSIYSKNFSYGELPPEKAFKLPKQCVVVDALEHESPSHILKNIKTPSKTLMSNDALFFTDEVDKDSIGHTVSTLKRLDERRQSEGSQHHISMFLKSPGGGDIFSKIFIDTLHSLKTPVDIIVTGLAASAAAMFLSISATGKRLATPSAMFMLHESAAFGSHSDVGDNSKKFLETVQRNIALKTGREVEDVRKDIRNDYYLTSLEALFYGNKGLIDGIVVGPRHVITQKDVKDYLVEKVGSLEKVDAKIKERLERRRDMHKELDHDFNPDDPFDNVIKTFEEVTKRKTRILGEDPDFKHSGPNLKAQIIEHIPIKPFKVALR